MQIYAYLLTPPNFSYIYNNIAPFFYYIIMELLLETTKGKAAISATFSFLHLTFYIFHLTSCIACNSWFP